MIEIVGKFGGDACCYNIFGCEAVENLEYVSQAHGDYLRTLLDAIASDAHTLSIIGETTLRGYPDTPKLGYHATIIYNCSSLFIETWPERQSLMFFMSCFEKDVDADIRRVLSGLQKFSRGDRFELNFRVPYATADPVVVRKS